MNWEKAEVEWGRKVTKTQLSLQKSAWEAGSPDNLNLEKEIYPEAGSQAQGDINK